jgi:SPP1 gp7 family putative phage head morphogenesis protein
MNINFSISLTDITPENKQEKLLKAIRTLSGRLDVPVSVEGRKKHDHGKGEPFLYRSHEDLIYKWYIYFSSAVNDTYKMVISYFGLPEIRVLSKADVLKYQGKIIYNPETGEPIKQSEWDSFVKILDKFLNRKVQGSDKRMILNAKTLGRILGRMAKYNKLKEVTDAPLSTIKYHNKTFDWISDSVKNMRSALGEELTRGEMARIQVLQQSAAQRVTKVSDNMKNDIKQILIDGVKSRKSKSQISQDIFDKMTGHNRDFQKIADTEIQNAMNNSYLLDEIYHTESGEKVYFQRVEVIDENTCQFCKKMHGKIVLWSDHPLLDDRIKDPIADFAIWDGKDWDGRKDFIANGAFHPYCRGIWTRYYDSGVDALIAHTKNQGQIYDNAVEMARAEFKEKGIINPTDTTPGFIERINELFNQKSGDDDTKKSIQRSLYDGYVRGFAVGHRGPLAIFTTDLPLSEVIERIKKVASHYPGEAIYFRFPGKSNQTFESLEQAIQWFTENWPPIETSQKSLTWSGYELEDRYKFAGFNISVENKRGSTRSGTDKDGHEWHCRMFFDYGYIRGTEGVDGDHVDVYIGPDEETQSVYIVHQNDPVTGKYDEDKVMLGFSSLHDARAAYLKQYDRPGFLGKIDVMPIEEFREKVLSKQYHGKMIKSVSQRVMELLSV